MPRTQAPERQAAPERGTPTRTQDATSGAGPHRDQAGVPAARVVRGGVEAVPRNSRPRGDHPVTGTAIPRSQSPVVPRNTRLVYYPGFSYYPYGAFGLGYFYYDPFWWGSSSYGYGGYGGYGYGHGYGYYDRGALRLKVKPRDAQVFVDGYFVGLVDDFDGVFQRLHLDSGPHRVEIRAPGYEALIFEVRILTDDTITYRGELRLAP